LNIVAEEHLVFEGDYVEKLGREDGYSHSYVFATCVDSNNPAIGAVVLCANKASYWSCSGDSGGVVFYSGFPWVPSTDWAVYWGINFAHDGGSGSCGAGVFSGIAQMELAYGNLITF
jgi:secreted trypsin-like serine protease